MNLVIHVVDRDVLFTLENNRVDVPAILLSPDVRFWVDVAERGQVAEMRVVSRPPRTPLKDLVRELDIPAAGGKCCSGHRQVGHQTRCPLAQRFAAATRSRRSA